MALIWWWLVSIGYRVRPYDMLCDRRRWFWQERTRCRSVVLQCQPATATGDLDDSDSDPDAGR